MNENEALETASKYAKDELIIRAKQKLLWFTLATKDNFRANWHHIYLCNVLDQFIAGKIKRLMIFMPPRHGKSELVSRRLPAFLFGKDPKHQVISTSYSDALASRMNRDVQRIIDSDSYRSIFPDTQLFGENVRTVAKGTWLRNNDIFEIVGHGGTYRSAGVESGITGMGADTIIIDDPIKNWKEAASRVKRDSLYEWFDTTLTSRLEKGGRILLTMTRWHEDDLAGRILRISMNDTNADKWRVIRLPAIKTAEDEDPHDPRGYGEALWPWKYQSQYFEKRRAQSERTYNALYQGRPTASSGNIIKRDWLKRYRQTELPAKFDEKIITVDCSFKDSSSSDFVAFECWGKKCSKKYLLDVRRGRWDFPRTIKEFLTFISRHSDAHLKIIEDKANGPAVISTLKSKISGLVAFDPKGSKEERLHSVSFEFEAGDVSIPYDDDLPWVKPFVEEILSFPSGENDDQVDACTMALLRWQLNASGNFTDAHEHEDLGAVSDILGEQSW